ncbi:MAG TPA: DHA2 family efflux MFS transporter permease subunit, partial [Candidatus Acidoferrales bacterium]|nr:DHA2 family efflux MFS transporter permease subunit [Candidatus Acidoferrales bacterium]
WRWVFFINIPISIIGLFLVEMFVFDPPYIRRRSSHIDYWGMGMLVTGIAALQVMLDKGQEDDWFGSHFIILMCIIAVAGLVAFVLWELHTREPVVHFNLMRYRTFATGTGLSMILFLGLYGSIVLLPLFMQTLLNFPAVTAGIWNSPRGIATLIFMPIAGFLIGKRWDMRALLTGGLVVSAIGSYMFSYLNLSAGPWDFFWPQMVMGAGLSFMFVPLATITVDPIPQEEMGYATSLIALARNLGAGFGISIFTAFIDRRAQFHQVRLVGEMAARPRAMLSVRSRLQSFLLQHGNSSTRASNQALAGIYSQVLRHASLMSYLDGFRVLALLLLVAAPFIWIMKKPHFKKPGTA